ncbi:MAG: tetratricopeptide repeat protein [Planctomycetota bacterium]
MVAISTSAEASAPRTLPPLSPWLLITIIGLAIGLYAPALDHPFVFDDLPVVRVNPIVHRGDVGEIFTTGYWSGTGSPRLEEQKLYRPITILSFAWTWAVAGADPAVHRGVNIALHVLVCLLVYLVARRLLAHPFGAGVAAVLFAAHPVHTEAVTYISGRADLLAAAGFLAAWWAHLARERRSPRARALLTMLSLAAYAAGLLSKEMAVTLPAALVLGDLLRWSRRGASAREVVRRVVARGGLYALYIALLIAVAALRYSAIGALAPSADAIPRLDNPLAPLPFFARLDDAVALLGRGIGLLIYPRVLSVDYSYDAIPVSEGLPGGEQLVWVLVSLVTLSAGVLALFARRWVAFAVSVLFYFATMLPVSNLLVVIGTNFGERMLYLPSLGICLALGSLARVAWRRGFLTGFVAASAVVILALSGGLRTLDRNLDYRSALALFKSAARDYPRAARAQFNLGKYLFESGAAKLAAGKLEAGQADIEAARRAWTQVLGIDPELAETHWALGNLARYEGQLDEALRRYLGALNLAGRGSELFSELWIALIETALSSSDSQAVLLDLEREAPPQEELAFARLMGEGMIAMDRGDRITAIARLEAALATDGPFSPARLSLRARAWSLLARGLEMEGRVDEARRAVERAIRLQPLGAAPRLELAELLLRTGDTRGARSEIAAAEELEPHHSRIAGVRAQVLWAEGRGDDAIETAEKILTGVRLPELRFQVASWRLQLASQPGMDPELARGHLERALDHLQAILEERPGDFRARFNEGVILERLGHWDRAAVSFETAADAGGRPEFRARTQLGELLLRSGRPDEARAQLSKALSLRSDHAPAWLALARASADGRDDALERARSSGATELDVLWALWRAEGEEESESLEQLVQVDQEGDSPRALYARAVRERDPGAAIAAWQRLLEVIAPGDDLYGLANLRLSKRAADRDRSLAISAAERAVAWMPESEVAAQWLEELRLR